MTTTFEMRIALVKKLEKRMIMQRDRDADGVAMESLHVAVLEAHGYDQLVNRLAREAHMPNWGRDQLKQAAIDSAVTLVASPPKRKRR